MINSIAHFLRMIKFSHTLFALPFALAAVITVHLRYSPLTLWKGFLIVISFTAMRSFAMAFNRLADHEIDAKNARTAVRELPAGRLSRRAVWVFAGLSLFILVVAAWYLNPLAAYCALPTAVIVASYSLAKRFTWLCHLWLGSAIGLAPMAVYVALLGRIETEALLMSATLAFYIAGFDMLYALQDLEFDRGHGLYSIPVRFGAAGAMWMARATHTLALGIAAALFGVIGVNLVGWGFLAILAGLLFTEHYLVGPVKNPRYEKIPVAFFNVNSAFSIIFLLALSLGQLRLVP